jgi:hypothetical protein
VAGLLSGVLPYVFSRSDSAKRYLGGLLSDPIGTLQQTAGGIVDAGRAQSGLLSQAFSNPQRPFQVTDSNALGQAADNTFGSVMGFAPAGITVYHGSPHVFDKFDSSKIGTGEGAQAYGHGIYAAESPEVAKQYSRNLSDVSQLTPEGLAARTLDQTGDLVSARQALYQQYNEASSPAMQASALKAIEALNSGKAKAPQLYKVDLPDSAVAKMLDWDKPLSQQAPEVQAAINAMPLLAEYRAAGVMTGPGAKSMGTVLKSLGSNYSPADASGALRSAGVPGVRYLDGGSRGAGAGSSNFVVFPGEEGLLSILERNGAPIR